MKLSASTNIRRKVLAGLTAIGLAASLTVAHPGGAQSAPTAPTVRRFFAPTMSWNRPVSELGTTTRFPGYAERMFKYAGAAGWDGSNLSVGYDPTTRGNWSLAFRDYSVPIYDAATATTKVRAFKSRDAQALGLPWNAMPIGASMPWNPNWVLGAGNDGIMAVVNYQTGEAWEVYIPVGSRTPFDCFDMWGPNGQAGYDMTSASHKCFGSVNHYMDIYNASTTATVRGMGINKLALLTRADEVASGKIEHALELTNFNTMFGAVCAGNSASAVGAGSTCGFSLAPATRVEHPVNPHSGTCGGTEIANTVANRERTVPAGMRFRLNISDADITTWLDSRKFTGPLRDTARIFAVALRDYGFIAGAETGCVQPLIETDGLQNPATKATWLKLGITDTGIDWATKDGKPDFPSSDILTGLITQARLEVVNPA
ncbi:MAG: hypothetical protein U0Q22_15060 [Acidimicrobiales bacterium]